MLKNFNFFNTKPNLSLKEISLFCIERMLIYQ